MPPHNISSASAFAPAHITGFFAICEHENPAMAGSLGCGITLESGVVTRVDAGGNKMLCGIPTIDFVASMLTSLPCSIHSRSDVPIGAGFGVSGAGAISTALALNHALSLDLTVSQLIEIAHIAEVENRTGLGDVVAQALGGVVIRCTPGASGQLDRICTDEKNVFWVVFDEISTKEILNDKDAADRINSTGTNSLRELLKKPTVENFMRQSKRFAVETDLASGAVLDAVQAVEAAGGMASQAMLGDAVFAIELSDEGDAIESALSEFGSVGRSRIGFGGAGLI